MKYFRSDITALESTTFSYLVRSDSLNTLKSSMYQPPLILVDVPPVVVLVVLK